MIMVLSKHSPLTYLTMLANDLMLRYFLDVLGSLDVEVDVDSEPHFAPFDVMHLERPQTK